MRVGQRLFLAVVPAIVGIFAVAGLAYWGRASYHAPEWVVAIAIVAATGSLVVSWMNTHYVARRIERLAARIEGERVATSGASTLRRVVEAASAAIPGRSPNEPDEIDAIEETVDRLSTAVSDAEAERRAQGEALVARRKEYADLVAQATTIAEQAIDEVRLPLHILLENRFGELNENQEEMLGAARAAAESASTQLAQLRQTVDFDRGAITPRKDIVRVGEVLKSLTPMLIAEGERRGVTPVVDITPGLPHVVADQRHVQEAVSAVLVGTLRRASEGSRFSVSAESDRHSICVVVDHEGGTPASAESALIRRLLAANGASLEEGPRKSVIRFPR